MPHATPTRWKVGRHPYADRIYVDDGHEVNSAYIGRTMSLEKAAQIVAEHNAAVEEAEHPERIIDKYFEDYSRLQADNRLKDQILASMEKTHAALVEALEQCEAIFSTGNVSWANGERGYLLVKAALRLAKGG